MDCSCQWTARAMMTTLLAHLHILQLSNRKPIQRYGQKAVGHVCRRLTLHSWSCNHRCNALINAPCNMHLLFFIWWWTLAFNPFTDSFEQKIYLYICKKKWWLVSQARDHPEDSSFVSHQLFLIRLNRRSTSTTTSPTRKGQLNFHWKPANTF